MLNELRGAGLGLRLSLEDVAILLVELLSGHGDDFGAWDGLEVAEHVLREHLHGSSGLDWGLSLQLLLRLSEDSSHWLRGHGQEGSGRVDGLDVHGHEGRSEVDLGEVGGGLQLVSRLGGSQDPSHGVHCVLVLNQRSRERLSLVVNGLTERVLVVGLASAGGRQVCESGS